MKKVMLSRFFLKEEMIKIRVLTAEKNVLNKFFYKENQTKLSIF